MHFYHRDYQLNRLILSKFLDDFNFNFCILNYYFRDQQNKSINNKNFISEEGGYNSSFSIISPHNQANNKRKSINPSPKNDIFFKSSPKDSNFLSNNNKNNKTRNVAVLTTSTNSPNLFSPKIQSNVFQSKLSAKPSLFDFIQSPPIQKQSNDSNTKNIRSNEMIEDFKNRFYLHQNNLQNCNQLEQKKPDELSIQINTNYNKLNVVEIRSNILKSVDQNSSNRISLAAKLFSDLFLSMIR